MITRIHYLIFFVLFLLPACSTNAVRNLASTTAANTSLVNTSLSAYAENSRRTVERRGRYISDVSDAAFSLNSDYEERVEAMERVEDKKKQKSGETRSAMVKSIQEYLDGLEAGANKVVADRSALGSALEESQGKFDLPSSYLEALAKALGTLSEKRDNAQTLAFLKKYFDEVIKQLKAAETEANNANKNAETGAKTSAISAQARSEGDIRNAK